MLILCKPASGMGIDHVEEQVHIGFLGLPAQIFPPTSSL